MRAIRFSLVLLCVLGLGTSAVWFAGCGDTTKTAEASCTCDEAKTGDAGWCEKCSVGYVKGEKTKCKDCVGAAQGGEPCAACAGKTGEKGGSLLADAVESGDEGAATECGAECPGKCAGECAGKCKDKDCACKAKAAAGSSEVACVCAKGKAGEPVWCDACNVGYVDGKKAGCPGCVKKALKKLEATKSPD